MKNRDQCSHLACKFPTLSLNLGGSAMDLSLFKDTQLGSEDASFWNWW